MTDPPSVLYLCDRGTSMARDRQGMGREHRSAGKLADNKFPENLLVGASYYQRFVNFKIQWGKF